MDYHWKPTLTEVESSNLHKFQKFLEETKKVKLYSYKNLYKWSIDDTEGFWESIWQFSNFVHSQKYNRVFQSDPTFYKSKFFLGAKANFAENLLRFQSQKIALSFYGENQVHRKMTYEDLYNKVSQLCQFLRENGVQKGDRVVGFLPNMPETIIAMLATTALGAIWSSCSTDFGVDGVLSRFSQIKPKVLFASDEYFFKGKKFQCFEKVLKIFQNIDSLQNIIFCPYNTKINEKLDFGVDISDIFNKYSPTKINFEQITFNDPVYIMYSSGTTGSPKCIAQGMGVFLNQWKELSLHCNLKKDDTFFYYTTCGWMMWNWSVCSLSIGSTLVLYDGSPFFPQTTSLLELIEKEKINIFGTSAKYIMSLEKSEASLNHLNLSSLKMIISTGSVLPSKSYDYIFNHIKPNIQISSSSGGTDLNGCFALGNPIQPVYKGELQCRSLGLSVKVFDENGCSVQNQKGELVCTKPFPCMPLYFYGDDNDTKYKKSYFDKFENIWTHGDFASITENEGLIIYGRSDTTLNPGGVRIGTSDIYNIIELFEEIEDSVIVDQVWKEDVRIILFVKMKQNIDLSENLILNIKKTIKEKTSPRHIPSKVIAVLDIPYTINMKKVEVAVKKAIHNEEVKNKDSLINPDSLEEFYNIKSLNED